MNFFFFWMCIRFVLPEKFKLALLTLELDFAKAKANRTEQVYFSQYLSLMDFIPLSLFHVFGISAYQLGSTFFIYFSPSRSVGFIQLF